MKAFVLPRAGATTIELADVPIPEIDAGEMLVRVQAVGVGIHDSYFLPQNVNYPFPIGIEAAGIIDAVGDRVTKHQPGDRIAFVSSMQPKGGTWAEFAAVKDTALIIPIPETVDFLRAAAVPVAGNTVLRAIGDLASIPEGGSVFVAGGSGAIGTLAIQLGRQRNWRMGASASPGNHEFLLELGAEKAVDYHDPAWREQVLEWMPGGVDGGIAIQPGTTADSLPVVRDGGRLIAISGDAVPGERGVHVEGVSHQADVGAGLLKLMTDIATGDIRVELERVYPFDEAPAALAKVQARRARGKVVLQLE